MNKDELQVGVKIRICGNPIKSIRKYYGRKCKEEIAGTIQTISVIKRNQFGIYAIGINYKKNTWTFVIPDISILKINTERIKPELFNPKNLMVETR